MSNEYLADGQPVEDREQRKFVPDGNGDVAVNVIIANPDAIGDFTSILQKLTDILASVDDLEAFTDGIEALSTAANTLLTTIRDNADELEGFTDGLEGLITASNVLLDDIKTNTASITSTISSVGATTNAHLANLETYTDGLEGLITSTNSLLTTIRDNADSVESLLNSIGANTDGLESLITTTNSLLTTIRDNADTVETLLTNIGNNTDGLEGLITASNALLTTIRDNADTLEALVTAGNASLASIDTKVSTAANQTTLNTRVGDLTETAPASDTASSGLNGRLQRIAQRITSLIAIAATEATLAALNVLVGAVTETAPLSDTASSGLNGRLQRIAQRLTSLITATTDRTQKTQLTNGTSDVAVTNTAPALNNQGLVTRPLPYEPLKYAAATDNFAVAATATDIARLLGSGSKTIRVKRVVVSGRTTSGSPVACIIKLLKRSTANTGGTSVATTAVPLDSTSAAATAAANHYTANPTVGTLVGNIATRSITFQQLGLVETLIFDFETPIILRGTAEQLSVNFNSTSVTGSSICVNFEWEEVA